VLSCTACFMMLRFIRCLARHVVRPALCSVPLLVSSAHVCVCVCLCVSVRVGVCVCVLHYVVLCFDVLRCATLCYAVLCCAALCYAMLFFSVFITMPISKISTMCWSDRYDTADEVEIEGDGGSDRDRGR
jgi:hypothetical protein